MQHRISADSPLGRRLTEIAILCVSIALVSLLCIFEVHAKDAQYSKKTVLRAIELSGGADGLAELGPTVARIYVMSLRRNQPGMSEEALHRIEMAVSAYVAAEVKKDKLENSLMLIYEHHLSSGDLQEVAAFYGSDAGKRYRAAMPKILAESSALGEKWAESIAPGVQDVIRKSLRPGHQRQK